MNKRILAILLSLVLVFSVFALSACNGQDESENPSDEESILFDNQNSSDGVSTDVTSDDNASVDNSSDDSTSEPELNNNPVTDTDSEGFLEPKNFGGREVTFLSRNSGENRYITYQVDCEEGSDDPVVNAFYRRNEYIKQNYGLDINVVYPEPGEDIVEMFRMDIMNGAGSYHGIVAPIYYLAPLAADGILKDFNSIDNGYVRLDKDYWDQALIKDTAIKDRVFFITGDALVQDDQATWCMYFNKDVIEEYKLENPYDLVRNDEWTIDKMYEMAQQYELTNGAYKSFDPYSGDKWGLVAQSYDLYQFMLGADQRMVDNSGDVPVIRINDSENIDTFNKIANWFLYDGKNIGVADFFGRWDEGIYEHQVQIFANGNALFMTNNLSTISSVMIREADLSFGIVPMPKRGTQQENYVSGVNAYQFDVIALPHNLNGEELDAVCYALEAMAYYGKELVTPEYYDSIGWRLIQDNDSIEMLDIIHGNRVYDLGSVFNFNDGLEYEGMMYFYTDLVGEKSDAIEAHFEKRKQGYERAINNLIAQCEQLFG